MAAVEPAAAVSAEPAAGVAVEPAAAVSAGPAAGVAVEPAAAVSAGLAAVAAAAVAAGSVAVAAVPVPAPVQERAPRKIAYLRRTANCCSSFRRRGCPHGRCCGCQPTNRSSRHQ